MLVISIGFYLLSFFVALLFSYRGKLPNRAVFFSIILALLSYFAYVFHMGFKLGSFPFANIYGFIGLLGNTMILALMVFSLKNPQLLRFSAVFSFFGFLSDLLALPSEPSPYRNPLYSLHMLSALFAYACAFFGGLASFFRLLLEKKLKHKDLPAFSLPINLLRFSERLMINLSFVFFTLTLIFGSFWTRIHFGKHWINDPKLLFTLLLWIYYAFVVHMNLVKGLRPRQLSAFIILGSFLSLLNLLFVRHEV
jgi:ABC-type uncharacterized transport system permease subunit